MKLNDILNESQINEFIPLTKQGRMIKRAEKAGAADMKASADKLLQQYAAHLGTQQKNVKKSSYDDLFDFLKSKKVDVSNIDKTVPINTKRIMQIFTAKIKEKMANKPTADSSTASATKTAAKPTTMTYAQIKKGAMGLTQKQKQALVKQLQQGLTTGTGEPIVDPSKVTVSRGKNGRFGKKK